MSMSAESSPAIATWLAGIWGSHKTREFAVDVAATYGEGLDHLPCFDCLYIAEAESGDFHTGLIGGIIKKWWMVDDTGLTEIRRPQLTSADTAVLFDRRPVFKFFTDGERVVVGERLGPDLICRKLGTIVAKAESFTVSDVCLLWTSSGHDSKM